MARRNSEDSAFSRAPGANHTGDLQSSYGHFGNNQEAHAVIDTVLNSGSGQVGTFAHARNLTGSGPPSALSPFTGANEMAFHFEDYVEARNLLAVRDGYNSVSYCESMGLHGTMQHVNTHRVPRSRLVVHSTTDTSRRAHGPEGNLSTGLASGLASTQNSFGSTLSLHRSCPECEYLAALSRVRGFGDGAYENASDTGVDLVTPSPIPSPEFLPPPPRNNGNFF